MPTQLRIKPGLLQRLRATHDIPDEEHQAQLMGVDRETLHRVNNGATPSGAFIAALCETFDLGIGEAFELVSTNDSKKQN